MIHYQKFIRKVVTIGTITATIVWSIGWITLGPLPASAAINNVHIVDAMDVNYATDYTDHVQGYPLSSTVKAGGTVIPYVFAFTQDASETFTSFNFILHGIASNGSIDDNGTSFAPATDLGQTINSQQARALLLRDETNPAADLFGDDTTSLIASTNNIAPLGSATTITTSNLLTLNPRQPATTIPGSLTSPINLGVYHYALVLLISSSAINGHKFRVDIATGAGNAIVTSANSPSVGAITGTVVTIDTVPPTIASKNGPSDNSFGIPVGAMTDATFSKTLARGSVSTTTVTLKQCSGTSTDTADHACGSDGSTVTGGNLCTTVTTDTNTTHVVCNHNDLSVGTWYAFRLAGTSSGINDVASNALVADTVYRFKTGEKAGGTNTTTPKVQSTTPNPGSIPTNSLFFASFSTDTEGDMKNIADNGVSSDDIDNLGNISVKKYVNGAPTTEMCTGSFCTLTWNSSSRILKLGFSGPLNANADYDFCIRGNAKNKSGQSIGSDYCAHYSTLGSTDTSAPTLRSTEPVAPSDSSTGISQFQPYLKVYFSKDIDPTTVSLSNIRLVDTGSNNILEVGDTRLDSNSLTISYDSGSKSAQLGLRSGLTANRKYCFEVTTGVKDLVGNSIASTQNGKCFTTGSTTDSTAPTLFNVLGNNYKLEAQFSKPVNGTDAETPANYTLKCNNVQIVLTGKTIVYTASTNKAVIQGLGMQPNQSCQLTVGAGVHDLAGNAFSGSNNTLTFTVLDATTSSGSTLGSTTYQNFQTSTDHSADGINPQRCFVRNVIAGGATSLECQFPAPGALPSGSQIILTMPSGYTYSTSDGSTRAVPSTTSFLNSDIDGPVTSTTPKIASVSVDSGAGRITITTGTADIAANAQVHFELDRLTNPTSPTSSAQITITLKDNTGAGVGTTIYPAPYGIQQGGSLTISGHVYKDTNGNGSFDSGEGIAGLKVFCDSTGGYGTSGFVAGHQETTTDGAGSWNIGSLSSGSYTCSVPSNFSTFSSNNLAGQAQSKQVTLNGASSTLDFKFGDLNASGSNAQTLTINIVGGVSLANKVIDVSCNGAGSTNALANGTTGQSATLDGSGSATASLKLIGGVNYACFAGPHIQTGLTTTVIPKFDFMPPAPIQVSVPTSSSPSAITFNLVAAGQVITGHIYSDTNANGSYDSGEGIANVFVGAHSLSCFDASGAATQCAGAFTQTASDGSYTLNVAPGSYGIGAQMPGMPPADQAQVTVSSTGTITQNGGTVSTVDLAIKKDSLTISGQILDETGSGIPNAGVTASQITSGSSCANTGNIFTGQIRNAPADSSGNYTLYVSAGTWCLQAYAPSYGLVNTKMLVISSSSLTSQNLQASSSGYSTISGTAPDGAAVNAFGSSGGNQTFASGGTYSLKIPAGSGYTINCYSAGSGPCGHQESVNASSNTTVNFGTSVSTGTVKVVMSGITDGFVNLSNSDGTVTNGTGLNSSGTYTLKIKAGTYSVHGGGNKYGELCSGQQVIVTTANTDSSPATVTCTAPNQLSTVTGRVTDGTNNLSGATVNFSTSTGKSFIVTTDGQTGTSNNLKATNVPDGNYTVFAVKSGYEPSTSTTVTVAGSSVTISSPITLKNAQTAGNGTTVTATVKQSDGTTAYTGRGLLIATKSNLPPVSAEIDQSTGTATLYLTNGSWTVKAFSSAGKKSSGSTVTVTNGIASSNPTLTLDTSVSGFTAATDTSNVTPTAGGVITSSNISGLSLNIPANTLSISDSNTGTVNMVADASLANVSPGGNLNFVGSKGFQISLQDSSGNSIGSSLSGDGVTLTLPCTSSDASAAGVDSSLLVIAALNANGTWETFPTIVDTINGVCTAKVTHFSSFGIIGTVSTSSSTSSSSGGSASGVRFTPIVATSSLMIDSDAAEATTNTVGLTLNASRTTDMMISNDPNFTDANWETYATTKTWVLTPGTGLKTVYAKFRSQAGLESPVISKTITVVAAATNSNSGGGGGGGGGGSSGGGSSGGSSFGGSSGTTSTTSGSTSGSSGTSTNGSTTQTTTPETIMPSIPPVMEPLALKPAPELPTQPKQPEWKPAPRYGETEKSFKELAKATKELSKALGIYRRRVSSKDWEKYSMAYTYGGYPLPVIVTAVKTKNTALVNADWPYRLYKNTSAFKTAANPPKVSVKAKTTARVKVKARIKPRATPKRLPKKIVK